MAIPLVARASGNLVVNGSFEAPALGPGLRGIYGTIPGWMAKVGAIEVRSTGKASRQHHFVEFDATADATLHQIVRGLKPGTRYQLSFDFANQPGAPFSTNGLSWSLDKGATWNPIAPPSDYAWHSFSTTFKAADHHVDLMFMGTGVSHARGTSLDNVYICAVPEPHSLALTLAGVGALGLMSHRRRFK
ncbi:DUF642 domain-containing protein [Roseateles sp. BYS180W]|uniref:DUF642 domain-containing protein n=1 Tax=Roseateles rivi TaxID=3299028 RepID=A0ABW7FW02_9BURK